MLRVGSNAGLVVRAESAAGKMDGGRFLLLADRMVDCGVVTTVVVASP